ncbi:MAG: hypothetical protein MUP82_07055 [Candidatus Marinimicrobia bacterium]|nr:hypothetical protein [Candidatus Neomarinimicrobiota bacterium]
MPVVYTQGISHDPKLSWATIKSEHFNVHVPNEHIKLGIKITDICEEVYPIVSNSLDYKPKLTHVIVHTENDESNGFTSPFPWRMELFVTPPQSNMTGKNITWLENLILHEFTHIVHLRKHKGLSTLTKPFLGDFNAVWQMATPVWFTEGIATLNETRFGGGGRGRNPHFWMQMAEPIINDNQWKLDNTNYYSRKKLPTALMPYISGYYITDNVNRNFGEYAWGRILNRYSSYPILGFKNAIKSITGLNVNSVYNTVISEFKTQEYSSMIDQDHKMWFDSRLIEGQYSPRWFDGDNILFYQKGISQTQRLVKINRNGEVQTLLNKKVSNVDNSYAIFDSIIYTSEQRIAPTYTATKYLDLHSYDLKTKNNKRITNKQHFYSIDISQVNGELIGVQTNLPNNRLTLIDSRSGEVLKYINFKNLVVLNPRWSPSGGQITFALQDSTGTVNIAVYNLKSNTWRYIYEPNLNQDNHPCWSNDEKYIYFSSDQSGVFNIWAADVNTGERWMITDVELGAFTPDVSPKGDEIAFSMYTEQGFRIATQKLDFSTWVKSNKIIKENKLLYARGETIFSEIDSSQNLPYSIAKYSPLSQIIKPQGWIPFIYDDEEGMGIAAYLRAEDALHRHMWYGKFGLSLNQTAPAWDMTYIYSKYFLKVNFRTYNLPREIKNDTETGWWREHGFEAGVSTPLILENNIYNTTSLLSMQYNQNQLKNSKGEMNPNQEIYRGVRFEFLLNRSRYTFRNITPYFAWFFNTKIEASNAVLYSDYTSSRFSSELDLFLPIFSGSNLELYFGYLLRKGDYDYPNDFVPIGFKTNDNNQQFRITTAYYQPLVFLEWQTQLIPIFIEYIYLKPFFDYSVGYLNLSNRPENDPIHSIGVQLSTKNIIYYRLNFEMGINVYKKSIGKNIEYNPFIRFNL